MKRLFAHIGFSVAVTLLAVNLMEIRIVPIVTGGLAVLLTVSLLLSRLREAVTAPLCLSAALFACLVYLTAFNAVAAPALAVDGKTTDATGIIVSLPEERNGKYSYTVKLEQLPLDGAPQAIKVRLTADEPIPADAYQELQLNLSFRALGSNAFSSYGYWGKGIFVCAEVNTCMVTGTYRHSPMRHILHLRRDIIETFKAAVPGDAGALAAALITGDKSNLSDEAYAAFTATSMSHLMAVSGLHLSVVIGSLYYLLKRFGLHRRLTAVIAFSAMLFYLALTGFSRSAVRAGIMLAVLLFGDVTRRKGDTLNSLGFAVFIICLNPFAVSDLSALLSVLAVLALSTLHPSISRRAAGCLRLDKSGKTPVASRLKSAARYAVNSVSASLAVLLYTLPVLYLYFGRTSPMSVVGNLLITPFGSADIVVSLFTYVANKAGVAAPVFNAVCLILGNIILKVVSFLAAHGIGMVFGKLFGLALGASLIIFGIAFMMPRRLFRRIAAVLCALMLTLTYTAEAVQYQNEGHLCLCPGGGGAVICHDDVIVWNINSYSDYYTVVNLLDSAHNGIDLLVCDRNSGGWSERLAETYGCDTAVTSSDYQGDRFALPCRHLVSADSYTYSDGDKITVDCSRGTGYYYINMKVLDSTVTVGKNVTASADIVAAGKKVTDINGTVRLSEGAVMYDIRSGNQYTARRVEAWQALTTNS